MKITDIPVRHSRARIDRFWPVIHHYCTIHPGVLILDPGDLRCETYASYLRDAISGIVDYRQGSNDQFRLVEPWYNDFTVSVFGGNLLFGSRRLVAQRIKELKTNPDPRSGTVISEATLDSNQAVDASDTKVLTLLVQLFELGHYPHLVLSNTTAEQVTTLLTGARPYCIEEHNGQVLLF